MSGEKKKALIANRYGSELKNHLPYWKVKIVLDVAIDTTSMFVIDPVIRKAVGNEASAEGIINLAQGALGMTGSRAFSSAARFSKGHTTPRASNVGIGKNTQISHTESFTKWSDMKSAHKGTVTEFVKTNKPKGSPVPKNWFEKGGSLSIDTLSDGSQIWNYTNASGTTVPYVPKTINGQQVNVIDFPKEFKHADGNIASFNIDGGFTGNRGTDKAAMLNHLKINGYDGVPRGYILHHGAENGGIDLVKKGIHQEFSHYGGYYYYS